MLRYMTTVLVLSAFSLGTLAQNAPQLADGQSAPPVRKAPPASPPPPATDQQQFVSYWTTETGWNSELQLRNNAVGEDVTVTPVLRLPDGTETALPAVTIKPQEVKAIDIDAAITAATPQLVGVYGSVVLRYRSPYSASLYAAMMIRKTGHAIALHIDAMGEAQDFQSGSREGVWWLPKTTTSDYLILTNQGKNIIPLDLSLYDASGKESKQKVTLGPGATSRYSVRQLLQAAGIAGFYGGLKISTNTHAGSLDSLHFLYDETAGFSAILKMFDYNPSAKLEERDYAKTSVWTVRAPMLALSNPDRALAFPPETTLQPQLFLRNTTAKFMDAALLFNWRTASATGKAPGPTLRLSPYETRRVDVAALQDGKMLPVDANWASVTVTTDSKPDELIAVAASYDATLRFGAQTPFSDQLTFKWEGGMWEYDSYHDSIITAGNGGTKPTQAAFTIFYNQGTQRYDLEQTLQPDEQMWMDIGKLIREHVPDKNGKTLPADLTVGSYEFRDLTNNGVGTLFEGKVIYDKTYGHVAYGCAQCCGYQIPKLFYDPLGIPFLGTSPTGVTAWDTCWSTWDDVSESFYADWSTASPPIATADYYGTHTGNAVGSTTSTTSGYLDTPSNRAPCPRLKFTRTGNDNVTITIKVNFQGSALTPGDSLNFSNVAQTCSSSLGLKNCSSAFPSTWVWNVEVVGTVDDASKYTVSNGVVGLTKGSYKDSQGNLHSFSTQVNLPAPQDNPPSAVLQQIAGQKAIFWLDAPGRGTTYTDPNNSANSGPIDSMTLVKNFTSSICSTANPNTCATIQWYIKIVVNSGAILDTTNSAAANGSLPLNF